MMGSKGNYGSLDLPMTATSYSLIPVNFRRYYYFCKHMILKPGGDETLLEVYWKFHAAADQSGLRTMEHIWCQYG